MFYHVNVACYQSTFALLGVWSKISKFFRRLVPPLFLGIWGKPFLLVLVVLVYHILRGFIRSIFLGDFFRPIFLRTLMMILDILDESKEGQRAFLICHKRSIFIFSYFFIKYFGSSIFKEESMLIGEERGATLFFRKPTLLKKCGGVTLIWGFHPFTLGI